MENKKVPFNIKDTLTIAVSIVILIALYKVMQLLGVLKTSDERAEEKRLEKLEKKENKDIEEEKIKLEKQGQKLSHSVSFYGRLIDDVIERLNGAETPVTELEVAKDILNATSNQLDWNQFNSSFGKSRDVEDIGFGSTTYYSFSSLLKDQLDSGSTTGLTVFQTLKNAMAKKGIKI